MYEHLNLRAWPFQDVPDAEFARIWAGRRKSKEQLDRLLGKMQFAPKSSIHLLWANFGMGKTHTLLHLQYLSKLTEGKLIPVYAVMPNKATGFLDLYRAIVTELPYDFLGEQLIKIGNSAGGSVTEHAIFRKSPGTVKSLLAIRSGDMERAVSARQWLSAKQGLSNRDLRSLGITYRIRTPDEAVSALTALTQLATYKSNPPSKLVIMIDDFQSIGELRDRVRREINSGIEEYYNENPNRLELILSFSFGRQDNVAFLLSNQIKSRADPESITLDVLTEAEAEEFVHDLLDQFRIIPEKRWAFPFTPEAVRKVIKHIKKNKPLTPRRLMLYFNYLLLESQYEHSTGSNSEIDLDQVEKYLSAPRLGAIDVDTTVGDG